ncbi:GNAT family N-acetyltransferase [Salinigranum halophilum]|uniref:GNAT family N-acetyltransferase n=1 Tax=Salinigranum halophilum TaxID=2565931 RepID=UPI0010A8065E|nr:GNAT family N-acetyltransferase [Salinigranum halophilum]
MTQLWRFTRNRYGRAVYDTLARAGITATVMYEYVTNLDSTRDRESVQAGYDVDGCNPGRIEPLDAPVDELQHDERIIVAFEEGEPRGYLFVSIDVTHQIVPLEQTVSFDGAYIRRVYVHPAHRNRGIATALVAAACQWAADRDAGRATALVALDNKPSRRLFEQSGFEPRRVHRYARIGPVTHRSVRTA